MTVRVGIIGTGVMGADHARLLGGVISGAEVGAVFDVNRERARAVAATHPAARVLDDPIALIRDGDIDAVLIASSDPTHEQFVLASLDAGKPVLCEKPLAPTADASRRIIDAEVASGARLVSVGFMRRYDPGYVELKSVLDDGQLGAALLLHCVHRNPAAPVDASSATIITNSAIHEIDISRWLLNEEIVAVTVHRPRSSAAAGTVQDPQVLILESATGALVDIEIFLNARYGYEVRCELVGEDGTVSLDGGPETVQRRGGVIGRRLPGDWRPRFAEAYRRELQDWVDGLRSESAPRGATAWDGHAATVVAEACVCALETGVRQSVQLPDRPKLYK